MENFGKKIRDQRKSMGIKQGELAQFIGVSQAALNKIEMGKTRDITLETAKKIAEKLEVSFMDFFEVEDHKRMQAEDRTNAKEWILDDYIENIKVIQTNVLDLLGKYAENLSIPVSVLFESANLLDHNYSAIAELEFRWQTIKTSGLANEEEFKKFVFDHMMKYQKLFNWFQNHRMNKNDLKKYIPKNELESLDYSSILSLVSARNILQGKREN
ncbi:helix-turn-helix domain-containing protein [Marinilabilia salmonicolor]|uniref:helix-turn-helix domain-containing protein n=1 Tax=Marinilabilia salmonicolor TaxID=989 RepID=UPI00029B2AF8|nr:helix-turn-helix transcriptional regulator [Marinilabilia salmonicolor]